MPTAEPIVDGRAGPLAPDVQDRIGKAVFAAVMLLPDAERFAWRAALEPRMFPGDVHLSPDGWLEFTFDGLPSLRIHEKAVGGLRDRLDPCYCDTPPEAVR